MSFGPLVAFFGTLSSSWVLGLAGALFLVWGVVFWLVLDNEKDRETIRKLMRFYSVMMTRLLKWVDRALTPGNVKDFPKPESYKRWWLHFRWAVTPFESSRKAAMIVGRHPWGWPLFDLTLRLAVAYPIVLLVVQWGVTGEPGRIGALEVLPGEVAPWFRWPIAAGIAAFGASAAIYVSPPSRVPLVLELAGAIVLLAGLFAIVVVSGEFPDISRGAFAVALAGGLIVAFVNVGTGAFVVVVVFLFTGLIGLAFGVATAFEIPFLGGFTFGGTLGFAIAGVGGVALLIALPIAFAGETAVRRGGGPVGYFSLVLVLALLLAASAVIVDPTNRAATTWLIFFGVMPLVNAVFDYFSMGLTRWLLRLGARHPGWAIVCGLGDLAAALAAFVALGFALIAAIHGMNALAGAPLLDLQTLFADLREGRWQQYWWLYLIIFSTVVPTLLHAAACVWSFIAWTEWLFKRPALWLMDRIAPDHGLMKVGATFLLSLMATLAVVVPVFVLFWGGTYLIDYYPEVGREIGGTYLWIFESFAQWLGAAVEPGPRYLAPVEI